MAYDSAGVRLVREGSGGLAEYVYDTTDIIGDVDAASYFTDGVSVHNMAIGDLVTVRVWSSAVPALTQAGRNAATLSGLYDFYVTSISTNAATILAVKLS